MPEQSQGEITVLLQKAAAGDQAAEGRLFALVETELRAIAMKSMRDERIDHTLQGTVIIDDAFLRLVGKDAGIDWQNRRHFYCAAARAMRRILIDHERSRRAKRRGGGIPLRVVEDPDEFGVEQSQVDLLALDEALTKLADVSPRQSEIVELHHFGGYSLEEAGKILEISRTTAKSDWRIAKAWLYRELSVDPD